MYAIAELSDNLCPWCIADGSAAKRFDAMFTDDTPVPHDVPGEVIEAVTQRTPGFSGWQHERWLYHCGDGMAFCGLVGWADLQSRLDALDSLRRQAASLRWTPEEVEIFLRALDKNGSPTAYLFRGRNCGIHAAFSDTD